MGLESGRIGPYLDRLGLAGDVVPTHDWLRSLHLAHLGQVPFENLDLHAGVALDLGLRGLHAKIVGGRRGGYCYEVRRSLERAAHHG